MSQSGDRETGMSVNMPFVAPTVTINASAALPTTARSDTRKVWLMEIRNNSLSGHEYQLIVAYLEQARQRELSGIAEGVAEVHKRTLEKLADR